MPQGLEVWDANGNEVLSTTKVVGLLFGSLEVPANQLSGSITNAKFANGTPFALPFLNFTQWIGANRKVSALTQLNITFSGTTMTWSRVQKNELESSAPSGIIHYGVYSRA